MIAMAHVNATTVALAAATAVGSGEQWEVAAR